MSLESRVPGWLRFSGVLVVALGGAGACRRPPPDPVLTQLVEARGLAADLRVQFAKASEASDLAVMADTDEASIAFAGEAGRTTKVVQADVASLASRLQGLGYRSEAQLLDDFSACFAKYQSLDHSVLELAVKNTNLKAQRISFGPVREAADAFRDSLSAVSPAAPPKDRCRVEALVSKAVLAVREIQVLQAPHIAEPDDAAMDRLEKQMAALETSAREAMSALAGLAGTATRKSLADANAALAQFGALSYRLVVLSRLNSNVRSFELSLRQKPALTAACDASLVALQEALAKEGFSATR